MALEKAKKTSLRFILPAILLSFFVFTPYALAGEDCSSITTLSGSSGSISDTTAGKTADNLTGSGQGSPDLIYQISVADGYSLTIGATTSYDSVTRIALASGGCTNGSAAGTTIPSANLTPTQQYTSYHDDPNSTIFTYINDSGSTQDIYWVQSGYYSNAGSFTLEWSITENSLYTTPTVSSPCCGIGIDQVILDGEGANDINNSTGTPTSVATYSYYNSIVPQLQQGGSYTLQVSGGYPSEVFSVWVDFNQDGDFVDTDELIADNITLEETTLSNSTINIPVSASLGTTRLRIGSEYSFNTMPTSGNGPNTYGEYEDYDIEITSAIIGPPTGLAFSDTSISGEVSLSWTAPTSSGSGPLQDYIILYGLKGGLCDPTDYNNADFNSGPCSSEVFTHSPTNPQSGTITGLTPHFQYQFAVFARNTNLEVSISSNSISGPSTIINNLSPNSAVNDNIINVTINGDFIFTGPTPAATTAILKRGVTTITCDNPIYSTTSIECDFDITGKPVGSYQAILTNYDSSETISENAFYVQAGPMTLNSVTPNKGNINGGTIITIDGSNFIPSHYQVQYGVPQVSQTINNFQLPITLDTGSLISTGKMNSDCSDIRFKDSDQTTDLDFFIEGPCNSANTKIWVELPSISSTTSTFFYLEYGNLSLSPASNAANTFVRVINNIETSWDMDEASGDNIADTSGNGLDATYFSGGYIYQGRLNWSRLFAPGRYAIAGNPAAFQLTGPFSLEAWVKLTSTSNGTYPRLISKLGCYPYNGYELLIGSPNGGFLANRPYLQVGNGSGSVSYIVADQTVTADNTWHHIVATYDPSAAPVDMAKIYVDGQLSISSNLITSGSAVTDNGSDLYLGVNECFGNYLSGYLDSVKIYSSAISAGDVEDLYNYDGYTSPLIPDTVLVRKIISDTINPTTSAERGKGLQVNIDGQPAFNTNATDNNTLLATTPAHVEGTVDVEVINSDNSSETLPNSFTYYDRKLKITDINGGISPIVNEPFSITVQAVESDNNTPYNVESDTYYVLNVQNGSGQIIQAEGLIPSGQSQNTRSDYAYSLTENNVTLSTSDSTQEFHYNPEHLVLNSTTSSSFDVVTGDPAANPNSTLVAVPSTILADGVESSIIRVMLRTATNEAAHDKTVTLSIVGSPINSPTINYVGCEIGPEPSGNETGITDANGDACFRVRSLYSGTYTFQAFSDTDSLNITSTADVTFTGPNSANSTLVGDRSAAPANGDSGIVVTAGIFDSGNNPFANRPISLNRTDSNPGLTTVTPIACPGETSPVPGTTNAQGHACFSVTSFTAGNYTFDATNSLDNYDFPTSELSMTFGSGLYWGNDGLPIANGVNDNSTYFSIGNQQIILTPDGGNIVVWTDDRNGDDIGPEYTIYAQKFSSTGTPLWNSGVNFDTNGIKIFDSEANSDPDTADSDIQDLRIISDGDNGAIITWMLDTTTYDKANLVGQRIDLNGNLLWGSNFKVIESGIENSHISQNSQYDIDIDGYGGAFLTYRDYESSGFNGQFTYYNRFVTRIGSNGDVYASDGPEADGYEEDWPVNISGSLPCENTWGKVRYYERAIVRVVYDTRTFGSCIGDANRRRPLAVTTLNSSHPDDGLTSYFVSTNNMNNYAVDQPYDTANGGGGYSTGCTTSSYAYDQAAPIIMNDDNGGVYITYAEACEQNIFINAWDVPYFVTHIPNSTSAYQMGSRQIGVCPSYSCLNYEDYMQAVPTADGSGFFVAWYDQYDENGHSVQKFSPTIYQSNYSVPVGQWDYDDLDSYQTPFPYRFGSISSDNSDGLYIVHNYNIFDAPGNFQPRIRATHINGSGNIVNGWTANGNQVSNIGSEEVTSNPSLQYMPYQAESLGSSEDIRNGVSLSDSSGNLVTLWQRTGYPIYGKLDSELYIQKMVSSTGLPAISPSEYKINHSLGALNIPEVNQFSPSVAKINNELVYAWTDDLDTNNINSQNTQIRVEKFSESGAPQWNTKNPDGRSYGILGLNKNQFYSYTYENPQIIADYVNGTATGNSILIANAGTCIIRQKLDSDGQPIDSNNDDVDDWGAGFDIGSMCDGGLNPDYVKIISDNNGGAYIFYIGYNNTIYGQHVEGDNGNTTWTSTFQEFPSLGYSYNGPFDIKLMNGNIFLVYTSILTSTSDYGIKIRAIDPSTGTGLGFAKFVSSTLYEYSDGPGDQSEFDVAIDPGTGVSDDAIYIIYKSSYTGDSTNSIKLKKYNHSLVEQFISPIEFTSHTYTGGAEDIARLPQLIFTDNRLISTWVYGYLSGNSSTETSNLQVGASDNISSMYWGPRDLTSNANPLERNFKIVTDGVKGAFIAFDNSELALNSKVYLKHIINAIDQSNNLALSDINDITTIVRTLVSDNNFGAAASWERSTTVSSPKDIYGNYFVESKRAFNSETDLDFSTRPADGTSYSTVVVTYLDESNQPISGRTITAEQIYGPATGINIVYLNCSTETPDTETGLDGTICLRISSTTPGLFRFAVYDSETNNVVISRVPEITFTELPVDEDNSSISANPLTVTANNVDNSIITVTVRNTANAVVEGKTVSVSNNGSSINSNPTTCASEAATPGITNSYGEACFIVDTNIGQIATFNAEVTGTPNVTITDTVDITFVLPAADDNISNLEVFDYTIENVSDLYYDLDRASSYNTSLIKATIVDGDNNRLIGREVTIGLNPNLGYTQPVSCNNPRETTLNSNTDDYGTSCFLFISNTPTQYTSQNVTVSATVDGGVGGTDVVLQTQPILTVMSGANSIIAGYRFRNDDGNELTATPAAPTNTPYYNLNGINPFRLRFNLSRFFENWDSATMKDEFTPTNQTDVGPRPLPPIELSGAGEQSFRASPGYDIRESTQELYLATTDLDTSQALFYKYDLTNLNQTPDSFRLPQIVNYSIPYGDNIDQPIDGRTHYITNLFIDEANNIMYFVLAPFNSDSPSDQIKIYKVDLATETVIDVLTQEFQMPDTGVQYLQDTFDSEIDLENGFLYITAGGPLTVDASNSPSRIMKVRLNGPTSSMDYIGQLVLATNNQPIYSSVIDLNNQFMYVSSKVTENEIDYPVVYKVDLDVAPTLPPVKIDRIYLNHSNTSETPGYQSAVLDTTNGYAYFSSSNFPGGLIAPTAYINKVDIDPSRNFELTGRLNISGSTTSDSINGAEFVYLSAGRAAERLIPTAAIDITNQYAFFPAAHYNEYRNLDSGYELYWKLMRVDLENFSIDENYDEITYSNRETNTIKGSVFSPLNGKGYFVRYTEEGDVLTEFNSTMTWEFKIQSAKNVANGYCDFQSELDNSYNWQDLPNADFELIDSPNLTNGSASSNVTGIISDNNSSFKQGELLDSSTMTQRINLGRNEYTEIEYSINPTSSANGSYCFRVFDHDLSFNHQASSLPGIVLGYGEAIAASNIENNAYPAITINGLIFDKTSVNIIEGTTTDTYGIKLSSAISDNVIVNISAQDSRITLSPDADPGSPTTTEITFNSSNWNDYQYITVSALNNGNIDGTTTYPIVHLVSSSDPAYSNIIAQPVTSIVTDYGSTSTNVTASVSGDLSLQPPVDFSFPEITLGTLDPNFSPALDMSIIEDRGIASDFTLTVQTSGFCKTPLICIPLEKLYLATANLTNPANIFNAYEINQFLTNYLQDGNSLTDRTTFVHSNSAEDREFSGAITVFDSRNVPSGSNDNPLQGIINFAVHLMIDYQEIDQQMLEPGTYTTTLVFDLNGNP